MHSFINKLETKEAHSAKLLPSHKLQLIFSNIVIRGDIFFLFDYSNSSCTVGDIQDLGQQG